MIIYANISQCKCWYCFKPRFKKRYDSVYFQLFYLHVAFDLHSDVPEYKGCKYLIAREFHRKDRTIRAVIDLKNWMK